MAHAAQFNLMTGFFTPAFPVKPFSTQPFGRVWPEAGAKAGARGQSPTKGPFNFPANPWTTLITIFRQLLEFEIVTRE